MKLISTGTLEAARSFNEAEVRFYIIDPIVRALGYGDGRDAYLKLEEKLDYPYFSIGRKSKKRDVPVGFPDYRAGIRGARGSFIIEAKSASAGIGREDVEQAHSYAAHAEVGAEFFLLCDGLDIQLFETLSGVGAPPIVDLAVSSINERFHELENILAPDNLTRHCRRKFDLNLKIGDGLGSAVVIRDGTYGMSDWELRVFVNDVDTTEQFLPYMADAMKQMEMLRNDFELRVGEGVIERNEDGKIQASVKFIGATKNSDAAMKLVGIDRMVFATSDKFLSSDLNEPSVFESTSDVRVDKGTKLPPLFGAAMPIDMDVDVDIYIKTRMYLSGGEVLGDYLSIADYRVSYPGLGNIRVELDVAGIASLRLLPR